MIEVRSEGHVSGGGEAIANVLDVIHKTPPLLNDDDARALARGEREIARDRLSVRREFDHVSGHNLLLVGDGSEGRL
jgi:hypothetical protein